MLKQINGSILAYMKLFLKYTLVALLLSITASTKAQGCSCYSYEDGRVLNWYIISDSKVNAYSTACFSLGFSTGTINSSNDSTRIIYYTFDDTTNVLRTLKHFSAWGVKYRAVQAAYNNQSKHIDSTELDINPYSMRYRNMHTYQTISISKALLKINGITYSRTPFIKCKRYTRLWYRQ